MLHFRWLAFGLVWREKVLFYFVLFGGVFYWCSHLFSYTVPGAQTPKLVADSQCDLAESRRRSQFSQKFIPLSLRRGLLLPIQLKSRERHDPLSSSLPGFACLFVCCRHNDTYIYTVDIVYPRRPNASFAFHLHFGFVFFFFPTVFARALPRQFHGSPLAVSGLRYFPVGLNCFRTSRIIYI